ncbi:DNAJ protein JJJ1 homolog [Tripterygium wilfordii]|nr:DNAJ protein JJJ1 homolog [Tripterygium wilfordii]
MSKKISRCYYAVIGLPPECTAEEIRSAYKKLALQRHPDKLIHSGLSAEEATARFQELAQAYQVLSDPNARTCYDSKRYQVQTRQPKPSSAFSNLFRSMSKATFSGYGDTDNGFYKVYSDIFDRIYKAEVDFAMDSGSVPEAPGMGNLDSPYEEVEKFYEYWTGFDTVIEFGFEEKKMELKAREVYAQRVRKFAETVKSKDKRVIDMEEGKKKLLRKLNEKKRIVESHCVLCDQKFKSEQQLKNHKQSKKHKQRMSMRDRYRDDDDNDEEEQMIKEYMNFMLDKEEDVN